jgi:3-oxoacyl-[acyl-carrier-protein] synthase II
MGSARSGSSAVVVGAGVRTPAGNTVEELWASLCSGRTTAEVYEDPRLPPGTAALACRIQDADVRRFLSPAEARRLDRSQALAVAAAADALAAVEVRPPPERCAVVCGVGLPGASTYEEQLTRLLDGGVRTMSPATIPLVMPSSVAAVLSMRHGLRGPSVTVSAACASGAAAIAEGLELLRRGAADLVLAGGVDSLLGYSAMSGFLRLDAMSRNVASPGLGSRPFDVDRDGFVMGEGAGFVVLTRPEDADGLEPLGAVLGHASTADAHHLVAPAPDGAGALRCLELALQDAGVAPSDVAHVNAHGTSTPLNDRVEATVLDRLFAGDCPPVTSVKGTTGHMIAGSGAVEAIVALRSLRERTVPPVAGLRTRDPEITVDVVQGRPRAITEGCALSSSFGFGGANTVLVLAAEPSG